MADKKKKLFIIETMDGGIFTDIADLHRSDSPVLGVVV